MFNIKYALLVLVLKVFLLTYSNGAPIITREIASSNHSRVNNSTVPNEKSILQGHSDSNETMFGSVQNLIDVSSEQSIVAYDDHGNSEEGNTEAVGGYKREENLSETADEDDAEESFIEDKDNGKSGESFVDDNSSEESVAEDADDNVEESFIKGADNKNSGESIAEAAFDDKSEDSFLDDTDTIKSEDRLSEVDNIDNSDESVDEAAYEEYSEENFPEAVDDYFYLKKSFAEVVEDVKSVETFPEDSYKNNSEGSLTEFAVDVNSVESFTEVAHSSEESFTEDTVDVQFAENFAEAGYDDNLEEGHIGVGDCGGNRFKEIEPQIFLNKNDKKFTQKVITTGIPLEGYKPDPDRQLKNECFSTGYHKKPEWVVYKQRDKVISQPRKYLEELRKSLYQKANAMECHVPTLIDPTQFLECQIKRQMRMEFGIPNYPFVPK